MASPSFSKEAIIVPLYPETKNVTSKYLSKLINSLTASTDLDDFIPPKILAEAKLLSHQSALLKIHRPDNMAEADQAKRRLAFEELYLTSIKAQIFRQQLKRQKAMPLEVSDKDLVKFVNSLPFTLTTAQKKAAWQIITDLKKAEPMNRLLNGDVGSGKTVVAAMAIFAAFTEGYRSIFMAPTEILASQHFESLKKILSPFKIQVGLLTSSR
jgi:ATP-dependent DNA helicase RecG